MRRDTTCESRLNPGYVVVTEVCLVLTKIEQQFRFDRPDYAYGGEVDGGRDPNGNMRRALGDEGVPR